MEKKDDDYLITYTRHLEKRLRNLEAEKQLLDAEKMRLKMEVESLRNQFDIMQSERRKKYRTEQETKKQEEQTQYDNFLKYIESTEPIEKLRNLAQSSSQIRLDMLRNILKFDQIDRKVFDIKVYEWVTKFNIRIEGDFISFEENAFLQFTDSLEREFESWKESEKAKKTKKELKPIYNLYITSFCLKRILYHILAMQQVKTNLPTRKLGILGGKLIDDKTRAHYFVDESHVWGRDAVKKFDLSNPSKIFENLIEKGSEFIGYYDNTRVDSFFASFWVSVNGVTEFRMPYYPGLDSQKVFILVSSKELENNREEAIKAFKLKPTYLLETSRNIWNTLDVIVIDQEFSSLVSEVLDNFKDLSAQITEEDVYTENLNKIIDNWMKK